MHAHDHVLQISDKKLRALQETFDRFDEDRSGFIDSTELVHLLRALGFNPPKHRVDDIMEDYDTDRNANLSFGEFVEVWMLYCQEAGTEMALLRKAFSYFDYVRINFAVILAMAPCTVASCAVSTKQWPENSGDLLRLHHQLPDRMHQSKERLQQLPCFAGRFVLTFLQLCAGDFDYDRGAPQSARCGGVLSHCG